MVLTLNKLSDIVVYNSITNTLADQKFDNVRPFSFIEFLNYTKSLNRNIVEFADYQSYLKQWNEVTQVRYNDIDQVIRQEFIVFLKTIALNYTTAEEKRYFSNLNFENNDDLEIAAPFFASKIKEVVLYFAGKRDSYKIDLELAKSKGSIDGVTNYLKTTVIETIFSDNTVSSSQPLSTVSTQLAIEVDTGYDTFNNYFDLDPFVPPSFYNALGKRAEYFTSNTNVIDKNLFLNYSQAIIDLINSERVVLTELQQLVITINTPDLNLLQDYDFIDYDTRTRENLRLILNAELIKKFTGTDFYYLSTTNTGSVLSGLLFEAKSPFANLLNVNSPSTLTVPQSSVKYERDVGLFFKPSIFSILQLQTPFTFSLKSDIKPGDVYIFPDPYDYGNITGVSKVDHKTPFNFIQQGEKVQKNISSNNALGNSLVTDNNFTFESYHSLEQNSVKSVLQDLYNNGVISNYLSDIYGNVYIGLKQLNSNYIKNFNNNITNNVAPFGLSAFTQVPYLSSIKSLLNTGTFNNTSSVTNAANTGSANYSVYNTRNSAGNFYIYNVLTSDIQPLSTAMSNVIVKYPIQQSQIESNLLNVEVFGNTFVFTASSYVVIDKVNYVVGEFIKAPTVPLILNSVPNSKASNVYANEDQLYVVSVSASTSPTLSSANGRYFYVSMYSYNTLDSKTTIFEFDSPTSYTFGYNFNTFINATNVNLIYNQRQAMFNVVITYKDLSNNIFLHSLFYRISNGIVSLVDQKIYEPFNVNLTVNYFDSSNTSSIVLNTLLTPPETSSDYGTITF
jgi:hypothetical protein